MILFRKKEKTLDLTEHYVRQKDRLQNLKEGIKENSESSANSPSAGGFGFLANLASANKQTLDSSPEGENPDERNVPSHTEIFQGRRKRIWKIRDQKFEQARRCISSRERSYHLLVEYGPISMEMERN